MARPGPYQQSDLVKVWDRVAETYAEDRPLCPDHTAYHDQILEWIGPPRQHGVRGRLRLGNDERHLGQDSARVDAGRPFHPALSPWHAAICERSEAARRLLPAGRPPDGVPRRVVRRRLERRRHRALQRRGKVALIREMWRVTRPGGLLLITVPNAARPPLHSWKESRANGGENGSSDSRTISRSRDSVDACLDAAGVATAEFQAHNPIVGWWFFALGKGDHRAYGIEHATVACQAVPIRARADACGEEARRLTVQRLTAVVLFASAPTASVPCAPGPPRPPSSSGVLLNEGAIVLVRFRGILQPGV